MLITVQGLGRGLAHLSNEGILSRLLVSASMRYLPSESGTSFLQYDANYGVGIPFIRYLIVFLLLFSPAFFDY